jgi:hypothetical protein
LGAACSGPRCTRTAGSCSTALDRSGSCMLRPF